MVTPPPPRNRPHQDHVTTPPPQLAERERAESSNEDVSVTLRKFSNAISDATVEKEDDDEEDAAPAK